MTAAEPPRPTVHADWSRPPQVVTIGHAIVDVLGHAEDAFLSDHFLVKGSMELVDEDRALLLHRAMELGAHHRGDELVLQSGGSAANTAVVSAMLGAPTAFVGKVRDDDLGQAFARDLHGAGVVFATSMEETGSAPTGRSLINVTPDAERTMCTYLGAARGIRVPDIDEELLRTAAVTYVEGYLWDEERAHDALMHAIDVVKAAGKRFSITLSDPFLVDRFRTRFLEMLPAKVDVLFANEVEICSLFETTDLDTALRIASQACEITTVTLGPRGAVVVRDDERHLVEAAPVERVVDTTGAGDAYAGGFLAGLALGKELPECVRLGNLAAGEVIARLGARPDLNSLDEHHIHV